MADSPPSLPRLAERWDAARTERTLAGLHHKRRRARRSKIATLTTLRLESDAIAVGVPPPSGSFITAPVVSQYRLVASTAIGPG